MNEQVFWSPGVTLEMIEKQVILNALRFYRGNVIQCAISLGVSDRTIRNKMEKYEQDSAAQQERDAAEDAERARILDRQRGIVPGSKDQEGGARIYGAHTGVHMEPSRQAPAQHAVPMSESEKIQSVLPPKASVSSQQRRR